MKRIKHIIILSIAFAILLGAGIFTYSFFYNSEVVMANQSEEEAIAITPEPPPIPSITPEPSPTPTPVSKITVVIDPGHGGTDSGADNHGVLESDVNLSIAKKLQDLFAADPESRVQILLTRTEDITVSLEERTQLANTRAQFFISIHCNIDESSTKRHGALTIFQTHEGEEMAKAVQDALVTDLGCPDWGLEYSDELYLLNHSTIPTIITEVGFLSNPEERALLASEGYQGRVADALRRAILELADRFE